MADLTPPDGRAPWLVPENQRMGGDDAELVADVLDYLAAVLVAQSGRDFRVGLRARMGQDDDWNLPESLFLRLQGLLETNGYPRGLEPHWSETPPGEALSPLGRALAGPDVSCTAETPPARAFGPVADGVSAV